MRMENLNYKREIIERKYLNNIQYNRNNKFYRIERQRIKRYRSKN